MNRNREFVIEYSTEFFVSPEDKESPYPVTYVTLRTMKHFHDWFNSLEEPILIISITERAGDPRYDKYFKEDSK